MKKLLSNLRGDIFGGVTAGIVALPLALAFGIYSGLGAEAGLYGAIALGFFASLFGGTDTQVSGPTGPMTVISALIISKAITATGDLPSAMNVILITFALAGIVQILLGMMRIGKYIRYIPYPVISGFMTGIGAIIILLQLFPLVGLKAPPDTLTVIKTLHTAVTNIHWQSMVLGLTTIAIIYLFPLLTRLVPSQLVALIGVSCVAAFWKIPGPTIGDIPSGLPSLKLSTIFQLPHASHYEYIIISALTLAALGVIDSLLTSVLADNMTKTKHNSNKELIGQGIGNTLVAFIGGIPGAGATMRTVVNINSGGKTRLSGMIHASVLLLILLSLHDYAAQIPLSVLAGILVTVGIGIIDYKGLKHIHHVPRSDSAVMLIVLAMTVFVNLLQAVIVGFILASILFMKKISDISEKRSVAKHLKEMTENASWPDEELIPESLQNEVYIKHLYGPLFFGFTTQFQEMVQKVPNVKYVIIRMGKVPYMDQTGLYAIEDAVMFLQKQGIKVFITGIQDQPLDMLKRIKLVPDLLSEKAIFTKFKGCINALQQ